MKALRTVFAYLKPYRRRMFLAFFATVAFTVLNLVPPLLMRHLIDKVLTLGQWNLLPAVVLAISLAPILAGGVRFGNVWIIMYVGRRVIADLRNAMYRKLLRLDMGFHTRSSSGAMVARLMDDVNRLQRMLTADTVRTVVDAIVFVFSLGFVFWVSPPLGGVLLGFVALYVLVYRIFSKRIHRATRSFRNMYDRIAGRLSETIAGVRQVRIYNREEMETELFLQRTARSLDQEFAGQMSSVGLGIACQGIAGIGSTAVVALCAIFVLREAVSMGDLTAVNFYIWMAISPAVRLTTIIGQMSETMVSVDRIAEVLDTSPAIRSPEDPPERPRGRGQVEFRHVTFRYESETPLFEDLSLTVPAGTTVALVGPTGCGKTTLVSLLMRHWDVTGGAVLIDGVDVRTIELGHLRRLFGVVQQDPVIFSGTLAENIAYGRPNATAEQIEQVARIAEVYPMARLLPEGFDTVLGTEGVKLSVGERQRISIARAVLLDPAILIMDEATSSLDSQSEALIQQAMGRVLKGRTNFLIAHRLSTITGADLIVVMEQGRIVQTGRHEELLAAEGGLYRALYEEMLGRETGGRS